MRLRLEAPLIIFLSAWALGLGWAGWAAGFLAAHNDYWGNVFIAQQMDLATPASFHNGFFPLGYPLLLKLLLGSGSLDQAGFWVNHFASLVTLAAAYQLARRLMPTRRSVLVLIFIALHPLCFFYFSTAGADPGSMAFFLSGAVLAIDSAESASWKTAAAAGVLLGLAALWRYHALIAGALFLAAVAVAYRRGIPPVIAAGWMALAYSPQVAVNMSLGLSPLHTNHALAVYDMMYGVNWYRLADLQVPSSMSAVILSDPGLFFRHYAKGVFSLLIYALPALLFTLQNRDPKTRAYGLAASLFLVGYAFAFGISVGGRAPLLVLPLALIFLGGALSNHYDRLRILRSPAFPFWRGCAAAGLLLAVGYFAVKDWRAVHLRMKTDRTYRTVERFLKNAGIRNAKEAFTTDFDLYFRAIQPFRPLYNGGWGLVGTYRWKEEFPQASMAGLEAFVSDGRLRKQRYVILNPEASQAAPFLGSLYAHFTPEPGLLPVRRVGDLAIFAITGETP